jgi:hypothetical protein
VFNRFERFTYSQTPGSAGGLEFGHLSMLHTIILDIRTCN